MRITGAGLRARREHLNLTRAQLGELLNISVQVLYKWETGRENAPYDLDERLSDIEAETTQHLYTLAAQHKPGDTIYTYNTDDEFRAHNPESPYNAAWHRMLCARLRAIIGPKITISYHQPQKTDNTTDDKETETP